MTVNIDKNLDLNITDFLLLQEISEMKLNRELVNFTNIILNSSSRLLIFIYLK